MVKALILDIDGVIVGDRQGYNFPDPHPEVIAALRVVHQKGIPVSLCTAKPALSIEKIIQDAGLDNPHITNGGAVVIDPIDHKIIAQHVIPRELALHVTRFANEHELYIELYTADNFYIVERQLSDLTRRHAEIERRMPELVSSAEQFVETHDVVKVFLLTKDEATKQVVSTALAQQFGSLLNISWTHHPALLPHQICVITAAGVSKAHGTEEIARSSGVPLADTLGVGDTGHDWQFMQLCGYAAAMGNATEELKDKVSQLGDRGYIGPSVNENGFLAILRHFQLLAAD